MRRDRDPCHDEGDDDPTLDRTSPHPRPRPLPRPRPRPLPGPRRNRRRQSESTLADPRAGLLLSGRCLPRDLRPAGRRGCDGRGDLRPGRFHRGRVLLELRAQERARRRLLDREEAALFERLGGVVESALGYRTPSRALSQLLFEVAPSVSTTICSGRSCPCWRCGTRSSRRHTSCLAADLPGALRTLPGERAGSCRAAARRSVRRRDRHPRGGLPRRRCGRASSRGEGPTRGHPGAPDAPRCSWPPSHARPLTCGQPAKTHL